MRGTAGPKTWCVRAARSCSRTPVSTTAGCRPVSATARRRLSEDLGIAPHFAIGARRAVSDRSDLGVRAEIDDIDGDLLLSVRALDYRYRLRNPLAFTLFLGASRLNAATPAYGYYFGAGVQWRNLLPGIDLNLDARYADKIARDKVLPSDPPIVLREDIFYDVSGATLSLSYRW